VKAVKRIAIIGGTHGNEKTGAWLLKKFMKRPELVRREGFETVLRISNEKAVERCVRYIEEDLNRRFNPVELADPEKNSYEALLAKELNEELGPKGAEKTAVDFIVDLHTTTSAMGVTAILDSENALAWQAATYLKAHDPDVRIFTWKGDTGESDFVHSIAPAGFALEVGPIPQGVLRADIFEKTERAVHHILDFFEKLNAGTLEERAAEVEVYDSVTLLDFPRDEEGEIAGMVHPELQDHDYKELKKGDPLFMTLEGAVIPYEGEEPLHAVFVNEAAYYEKGFAMALSRKILKRLSWSDSVAPAGEASTALDEGNP